MRDIRHLQDEIPGIGDVRGKGLMIGVEFVHPGTLDPDTATTGAVMEGAKDRGLLVGKGGLLGNVLRIAPPLSITTEEATEGYQILADSIREATSD